MKKELSVTEEAALLAHSKADAPGKALLENLYGKEVFNRPITERVKTFEDACAVLGIDPATVCGSHRSEDTSSINAYAKLCVVARALNEGWVPDYTNSSEYKYYPWMKFTPGSGFSGTAFSFTFTYSDVGSRLSYRSRELAEYAATQFADLYNEFLQ